MSELQKFENSDQWRTKLRNFLLRDQPETSSQSKGFDFKETNRYSFDIKEDLKKIIEEKKQKRIKMESLIRKSMKKKPEGKENENCNQIAYNCEKVKMYDSKEKKLQIADDTMIDRDGGAGKHDSISDESFEVMELMCNKSASDPDSTLFQYLHTEEKRHVLEMRKQRSGGNEPLQSVKENSEHMSINSCVNNLKMEEEKQITNESPLEGAEITQIEDIEAPSRMWDNTVLQTSPVKMVGLLRPSTILECAEISDVSSAQTSFKTAQTEVFSEGSACYDTASDTIFSYNQNKETHEMDGHTSVDLIDLEKTMQINVIKEASIELQEPPEKIKIENLIDLTIDTNYNNHSDASEDFVIELLSDDEQFEEQKKQSLEEQEQQQHTSVALIKFEDVNMSSLAASNDYTLQNNSCDQDILSNSSTNNNKSLHFNDTLEEVEYMMQKGLEFMAGAGTGTTPKPSPFKPKTLPSPKLLKKERTFTIPQKQTEVQTPRTASAYSLQKSAAKCENRFALDIKPFPKLDLFKKPLSPQKTANKLPATRPKDKFDHVVSPISMYIKKTGEMPLMSEFKKSNDKDSSVFRALDFESCQFKPHFNDGKAAELPKPSIPRSLPKKAYISSEYRQVTDERNAVTIPGSKCIQKQLDSALLAAVIKHDGKMNLASDSESKEFKPPQRKHTFGDTDSFANLSVITGDISMHTIKDAQKLN